MSHGDADAGQLTPRSTFYDKGRFGRLFPDAAAVRRRHADDPRRR